MIRGISTGFAAVFGTSVSGALFGIVLAALYLVAGDQFAGLGTGTINGVLAGTTKLVAAGFLIKIIATSVTLETGGSGGIVTPIFFIGEFDRAAIRVRKGSLMDRVSHMGRSDAPQAEDPLEK